MTTWAQAYENLRQRIQTDNGFPELVRCYGGDPNNVAPSRRAARLATAICGRLGLDPAVYRGNVFGAAATAITHRKVRVGALRG